MRLVHQRAESLPSLQGVAMNLNQIALLRNVLEATHVKGDSYAVRPWGQLGTCGYFPYAWTVIYVNANTDTEAVSKALARAVVQKMNSN